MATLGGGSVTAVARLCGPGGEPSAVLKCFTDRAWLTREPDIATREALATHWAQMHAIPAPAILAVDPTGAAAGAPSVLFAQMNGRVELTPDDPAAWLDRLAAALADVHAVPVTPGLPAYRIWGAEGGPMQPPWSHSPGAWRKAFAAVAAGPPAAPVVFLHRDYHPCNVLWHEGAVSAVLDWTNGCTGPRWVDTAHCRVNLVASHGEWAADDFLAAYRRHACLACETTWWDLAAVVEWLPVDDVYPGWAASGLAVDRAGMQARLDRWVERLVAGGVS